LLSINLG